MAVDTALSGVMVLNPSTYVPHRLKSNEAPSLKALAFDGDVAPTESGKNYFYFDGSGNLSIKRAGQTAAQLYSGDDPNINLFTSVEGDSGSIAGAIGGKALGIKLGNAGISTGVSGDNIEVSAEVDAGRGMQVGGSGIGIADGGVTPSLADLTTPWNFGVGNLEINSLPVATENYVQQQISGITWVDPCCVVQLVGNAAASTIEGLSPTAGDAYVVTTADGSGELATATVGDIWEFDGTNWQKIVTGATGYVPADTRAALATQTALISPYTDATDDGKVVDFSGSSNTGSDTGEAVDGNAFLVCSEGSYWENNSFVFDGTVPTGQWVLFAGPQSIVGGDGIDKSGNTVSVDLATNPALEFSGGKLQLKTYNGFQRTSNGLEAVLDGSSLAVGASGWKINLANANTWTGKQTVGKFALGTSVPTATSEIALVSEKFQFYSAAAGGAVQVVDESDANLANGYAKLDGSADVPLAQIPDTLTGKDCSTVGTYSASSLLSRANHTGTQGPSTIALTQYYSIIGAGGDVGTSMRNNPVATSDPGVNDDSGDGYAVGSWWINTTTDAAFICTDSTEGAAVWETMGGGAIVGQNLGGGTGWYAGKSGDNLQFKSFVAAGTGIGLSNTATEVTLTITPSSVVGATSVGAHTDIDLVDLADKFILRYISAAGDFQCDRFDALAFNDQAYSVGNIPQIATNGYLEDSTVAVSDLALMQESYTTFENITANDAVALYDDSGTPKIVKASCDVWDELVAFIGLSDETKASGNACKVNVSRGQAFPFSGVIGDTNLVPGERCVLGLNGTIVSPAYWFANHDPAAGGTAKGFAVVGVCEDYNSGAGTGTLLIDKVAPISVA